MTTSPFIHHSPKPVDKSEYKDRYRVLSEELGALQSQVMNAKARLIIVFEGMDAAGKGGTIRRIANVLDPRVVRVWPIAAPKPQYKGTHYLRRFWDRLPKPGEIAIFDRSWYGRLLVERVEGFASEPEWQRAFDEINAFEKLLVDDGVLIKKIFLKTSLEEQKQRLIARIQDPAKHWKITAEDFRNREKWPLYKVAIDDMLAKTRPEACPWHLFEGDQKKAIRLKVIEEVLSLRTALPALPEDRLGPELRALAGTNLNLQIRS